jgi:hypothetical protein
LYTTGKFDAAKPSLFPRISQAKTKLNGEDTNELPGKTAEFAKMKPGRLFLKIPEK